MSGAYCRSLIAPQTLTHDNLLRGANGRETGISVNRSCQTRGAEEVNENPTFFGKFRVKFPISRFGNLAECLVRSEIASVSDPAVIGHPENHRSLARATPNGTSASGKWCRTVQQARIRLLSCREYNMRRVLRGLVLRHRKSQRGQVNAAKKCLTLTEGNR